MAPADTARPAGRGRPPMSERRKAVVRMEIARAAVALFIEKGVAGTTGEDIAGRLGISPRTLWRYFPSKESCVRPLLTTGLDRMARRLRSCPRGTPLLDHLEREGAFAGADPLADGPVADLIRMADREPALKAVWLEVHDAAESVFAEIVAERTGAGTGDLAVRVQAASLNAALRLAAEEQARRRTAEEALPDGGMGACVRAAITAAVAGLPAFAPEAAPDGAGETVQYAGGARPVPPSAGSSPAQCGER
ncbi:TetR/AcrR family transcriptional regulator [Streptomonospora salina]|uniref:AcrR family transcriptional regulator n=1 Tax=Streptomonospora salina TaxID=104205 RepID=A0A841EC36_9ACTN|nr:TetR/AcrR family transcriptional regulator [Streptomonospora salina]MBB5997001.1 AcrR family transcriptional regulator [Streptomonospora salina]